MHMHVRALFTQDGRGRLVAVNEPSGKPAPRIFLGRTVQGSVWWLRHDLDEALVNGLEAVCREGSLSSHPVADPAMVERLSAVLTVAAPVERVWVGPAFVCPQMSSAGGSAVRVDRANADLLSPFLEDWRADAERGVPMAVSLEDRRAVSVCCSVRQTEQAHEAGVETHPAFRGRGHGARAVTGWANGVRNLGRVALYSTSWDNEASRRLAATLGLEQFGTDLHIS
jgi:GNAT acetyltransferase